MFSEYLIFFSLSFLNPRSAEQGLDLIKHLNGVETREKLLKNLLSKKENIMRKFVTEVGIVENEFLVN